MSTTPGTGTGPSTCSLGHRHHGDVRLPPCAVTTITAGGTTPPRPCGSPVRGGREQRGRWWRHPGEDTPERTPRARAVAGGQRRRPRCRRPRCRGTIGFNRSFSSDEVIRKRLLIDGDGAGDDRRINLLVKSFIKWCNSGSQEEGYSQYQRMLSTLSQCEFSMGKTLLVYDMNLREMENYEKIYKDIENSIAAAHEKISECKKQILQAKRIRKNRQEYDALAKVIQHHPDRHETLKQLEALGKELQNLSHIKENVEDKLELRRKQFHVLLSTIHELQQTLENDEKLSEAEESQETQLEAEAKQ
ncbi:THO complex subunit 7 homolog [Cyanistes caeruleus]|nr:THO complex subunit 7 homolog [Cyanistes caeruleus]